MEFGEEGASGLLTVAAIRQHLLVENRAAAKEQDEEERAALRRGFVDRRPLLHRHPMQFHHGVRLDHRETAQLRLPAVDGQAEAVLRVERQKQSPCCSW